MYLVDIIKVLCNVFFFLFYWDDVIIDFYILVILLKWFEDFLYYIVNEIGDL